MDYPKMNKSNFALFFVLTFALIATLGFASALSVGLVSPANSFNSTNQTISFQYSLTGNSTDATSCGLYLNNVVNATTSSFSNVSTNTITQTLPFGTYTWQINCSNSTTVYPSATQTLYVSQFPALSIIKTRELTTTQTALLNITNTGNVDINSISLYTVSGADFAITFNNSNIPFNLAPGHSNMIEVNSSNLSNLVLGDDTSLTLKAVSSVVNSSTVDISYSIGFCRNGNVGDLSIQSIDITNNGDGDENDWNPLDGITIDVEVENRGTSSLSNVYAEIKILDSNGNDVTDDFNFDDNKLSIGKINDGDSKTVTFNLPAVPADVNAGDYTLYVKAYKSGSESTECKADSGVDFTLSKEFDRAVIVKDADLSPVTLDCGSTNTLSFNIYNIGDNREKSVLVLLYNRELGIQQTQVVSDLKSGGKSLVTFTVNIPSSANKTSYLFSIQTYFDYNKGDVYDSASYDQDSENDLDKSFNLPVKTTCQANQNVAISPQLKSDAVVGKDLVVEVTVTNTGALGSFTINPSGYDSWANLVSVDQPTFNLGQGMSKTILVTLSPKVDGTHTFNLDVKSVITGQSFTQQAQVSVAKNTGIFAGLLGLGSLGLFLVIAIVLLVLLIVVVLVVRASSRKNQVE